MVIQQSYSGTKQMVVMNTPQNFSFVSNSTITWVPWEEGGIQIELNQNSGT